jgi:hypothetical protein
VPVQIIVVSADGIFSKFGLQLRNCLLLVSCGQFLKICHTPPSQIVGYYHSVAPSWCSLSIAESWHTRKQQNWPGPPEQGHGPWSRNLHFWLNFG